MEIIFVYPVFIGIALATAQLAHQKGYSSRWWFLWGILVPIISVIVLVFLPKKPKKQTGMHAPVSFESKDKVLYRKEN